MRIRRIVIASAVAAGALALGMVGGAAVASIPAVYAPSGVSVAESDVDTVPMPDPEYKVNASGLTFGSAAAAPSPDKEPALIEVVATNGAKGYVYKKDLDIANGSAAAQTFTTPAQALEWQRSAGIDAPTPVPVYQSDGKTVVGDFVVIPGSAVVEQK